MISAISRNPGDATKAIPIGRRRHRHAEIGQEPQGPCDEAKEQTVGHADQRQPRRDQHCIHAVDEQLQEQVTAHAGHGVIHGLGGGVHVAAAEEADEAVAEVVALHEDKKHEHENDAKRDNRRQALEHDVAENIDAVDRRWGEFDLDGGGGGGGSRAAAGPVAGDVEEGGEKDSSSLA